MSHSCRGDLHGAIAVSGFERSRNGVASQNGKNEENHEMSEPKCLLKEDERMHRLKEEEYGGAGQVLNKSRLFEHGGDARQGEISGLRSRSPKMKKKGGHRKTKVAVTQGTSARFDILDQNSLR